MFYETNLTSERSGGLNTSGILRPKISRDIFVHSNLTQQNKDLLQELKNERGRAILNNKLETHFFMKYGNLLKEWKELVRDNPFLTDKDFEE